jgi:hypothetical protein
MIAVGGRHASPPYPRLQPVLAHQPLDLLVVGVDPLVAERGLHPAPAVSFERGSGGRDRRDQRRVVASRTFGVMRGARDAPQPTSLWDGEPAGPSITDVGALFGNGPLRRAPFRNSNSRACLPTSRSSAAMRASSVWIRSTAFASSSNAPASYWATQTRTRLRQMSCRLARPCSVSPARNSCAT